MRIFSTIFLLALMGLSTQAWAQAQQTGRTSSGVVLHGTQERNQIQQNTDEIEKKIDEAMQNLESMNESLTQAVQATNAMMARMQNLENQVNQIVICGTQGQIFDGVGCSTMAGGESLVSRGADLVEPIDMSAEVEAETIARDLAQELDMNGAANDETTTEEETELSIPLEEINLPDLD